MVFLYEKKLLITLLLAQGFVLFFAGCSNFFEKKPTEIETKQILNELEQVKESPFTANPLPDLYKAEPKKMEVADGIKVFYFCRNHPADTLAKMLTGQFKYNCSPNSATNQIVFHCPDEAAADKAIEFLKNSDVPPIQVNIDCIVLERFADVTMDWETTLLVENLLGEGITLGEQKYPNPVFPGASLREGKRSTFGLDVGYWVNEGVDGHQIRMAVDLLESRGYLKILMNPKLETVNGKPATITSRENAPLQKVVTGKDFEPYNVTDYQWVEDSLSVTPNVFADGSIGLKTEIKIGSRSKPEGVVQLSIITERKTTIEENRIKPGDSLVVSGLRKAEQRSVIRGIPFFKDIPIIGILFSSKDYEEKGTEIVFILTPSISSNGSKNSEVVENIREKFKSPEYEPGLESVITDPFTGKIYTEHIEKAAADAEYKRVVAELEKAQADEEIGLLREELVKAAQAAKDERQRAQEAKSEASDALKKVKDATEVMKAEHAKAQKALEEANQARQQAEKARQEANQAKDQAEKARQEAEESRRKAQEAEEEKEKIKQQASLQELPEDENVVQTSETADQQTPDSNTPQN